MELGAAAIALVTATIAAGAAISASVVTQRMTMGRERELRRIEAEVGRRHKIEDLRRATFIELQNALAAMLDATNEVLALHLAVLRPALAALERNPRDPAKDVDIEAIIKPTARFMAAQARIFMLIARISDSEAKTRAYEVCKLAQEAKDATDSTADFPTLVKPVFTAFLKANRRIGDLIDALDDPQVKRAGEISSAEDRPDSAAQA
jgi:hypothetical protein